MDKQLVVAYAAIILLNGGASALIEIAKGFFNEIGKAGAQELLAAGEPEPNTFAAAEERVSKAIDIASASGADITPLVQAARLEISTLDGLRQRVHVVCTTTGCAPHREKQFMEFVDGIEELTKAGRDQDALDAYIRLSTRLDTY